MLLAFFLFIFLINMNQAISSKCLIICGPSGVGKGTIISALGQRFPNKTALSVSHTTRKPRVGEINGVHYHFVSESCMIDGISKGLFLETAKVHGSIYGTSIEAVNRIIKTDKLPILDVDVQGVRSIKSTKIDAFDAKYVFISPPSIEILENRLRARNTESDEQIRRRLENAKEELEYCKNENFDFIIVNDKLNETIETLTNQLISWFPFLL